ncbi:tRNA preQ1(34) S-adenosylmethionine ribosyltransferase-isomerase QueA [candidate division WOR-3 bacterium]|nr:tRNA preQ1(34) S-adenosylmethionine ribosyltransferase-isomerase QueA [candidate division WOR-3 bacterium]
MKTSDFLFDFPGELIAQYPREKGKSRLMVLSRDSGKIEHRSFPDILDYVKPQDCFALNNSRVIPARINAFKASTGSKVEIFLVEKKSDVLWKALVFPGKRARVGDVITLDDKVTCRVESITQDTGERILKFEGINGNLLNYGKTPLPPYITRAPEDIDIEGYQTIYAKKEGSVAAPTAGLHFSKKILKSLERKCVNIAEITLHVGPGTFRPVRTEKIEEHKMESEIFTITGDAASIINKTKRNGGKVFAVGTTTARVLESVAGEKGELTGKEGRTELFIHPPYEFKIIDHLLTNFHLPGSTLIMLVSAFASREMILESYREAIKEKYRFYSYGDAMLIL